MGAPGAGSLENYLVGWERGPSGRVCGACVLCVCMLRMQMYVHGCIVHAPLSSPTQEPAWTSTFTEARSKAGKVSLELSTLCRLTLSSSSLLLPCASPWPQEPPPPQTLPHPASGHLSLGDDALGDRSSHILLGPDWGLTGPPAPSSEGALHPQNRPLWELVLQ